MHVFMYVCMFVGMVVCMYVCRSATKNFEGQGLNGGIKAPSRRI